MLKKGLIKPGPGQSKRDAYKDEYKSRGMSPALRYTLLMDEFNSFMRNTLAAKYGELGLLERGVIAVLFTAELLAGQSKACRKTADEFEAEIEAECRSATGRKPEKTSSRGRGSDRGSLEGKDEKSTVNPDNSGNVRERGRDRRVLDKRLPDQA